MSRREATPEQKAAAEQRRAAFRDLCKMAAAMPDEQRADVARRSGRIVTCEGRALSDNNALLIALQRKGASIVGGFAQWLKAGRAVRKGEHGMSIWIPAKAAPDLEAGETETPGVRFLTATVFDISQTDALPAQGDA